MMVPSVVNNFVATLSVDGNIISNDTVTLATPLNPNTNMNYTFVNGWICITGFTMFAFLLLSKSIGRLKTNW